MKKRIRSPRPPLIDLFARPSAAIAVAKAIVVATAAALASGAFPAVSGRARAEDFAEWKHRLPIAVEAEGLVEIPIPVAILDAAAPDLADLRLADPAGNEEAFYAVRPIPGDAVVVAPADFRPVLADGATVLELAIPPDRPLEAVTLKSPTGRFLAAVRVEGSANGGSWETLAEGSPIFRQAGGAEQLRVRFPASAMERLRLTVNPFPGEPGVALEAATLHYAGEGEAERVPFRGEIVERLDLPDRTRLVVDLGAAHLDLASIGIETDESLFIRRVALLAPSLEGGEAREKTIAEGAVFRIAVDGATTRAELEAPVRLITPLRRLVLVIENGDSRPLAISGVTGVRREARVRILARQPGEYALFAGNSRAKAPRYDLSALATSLRNAAVHRVTPALSGAPPANPACAAPAQPAGIPTEGAVVDTGDWSYRRTVELKATGIQELELDADTLARSGPRGADWRLVVGDRQVPYVVERPAFFRSLEPTASLIEQPDPDRPNVSRWALAVPHAGLPAFAIVCRTRAPLFERPVVLIEEIEDNYGQVRRRELGRAQWKRTPEKDAPAEAVLELPLGTPPKSERWILEMHDGDNAAIALEDFEVRYPVVRLLFNAAAASDPLYLYYGNEEASPPRYDLALVGPQLLRAERTAASLGAADPLGGAGGPRAIAGKAGTLFWIVLALVVGGLLFLVARLLPKSAGEGMPPPAR